MAIVSVFMISVTPTPKAIQRQNLGYKTHHKNGNFYTFFVVNIFVCWFQLLFCVLIVINEQKRFSTLANVHKYLCVGLSVRAYICGSRKCLKLMNHMVNFDQIMHNSEGIYQFSIHTFLLKLDTDQSTVTKCRAHFEKGSLTVWALYAYFSDSQNAAFELLVVVHVVSVQ